MEMSRRNRPFIRSYRSSELIEGSGIVSNTNHSRGATMVKAEQATEPFSANDRGVKFGRLVERFDQLVLQALMVSFRVVMREILGNRVSQLRLIEKDHSVQALVFDAAASSLGKAAIITRTCRRIVRDGRVRDRNDLLANA